MEYIDENLIQVRTSDVLLKGDRVIAPSNTILEVIEDEGDYITIKVVKSASTDLVIGQIIDDMPKREFKHTCGTQALRSKKIEARKQTASDILNEASSTIKQRGEERDKGQERSMRSTVDAFNAVTGLTMTETQGWQFMVILKLARANGGNFKLDDYLDGAAYMALAGECELNEQNENS